MSKPVRLQLSRRKGFNLQGASMAINGRAAVNVARPGKWGNPFVVGKHGTRAECVDLCEKLLADWLYISMDNVEAQRAFRRRVKADLDELRGKNLACWCSGPPCHGDTLLRIASIRGRK
jgi:hypothetical protein